MEQRVIIDGEKCKSCLLCIKVCPNDVLAVSKGLNQKGYSPVAVVNEEACISCAKCAWVCPDAVISVYRPLKNVE